MTGMRRWAESRTYVLVVCALVATFCLDWFKGSSHWPVVVSGAFALIGGRMARDAKMKQLEEDG